VIGLKHPFEQADIPRTMDFYYPVPFMQYTQPLVDAPPGVLEGYEPFWELAKRLGVKLDIPGISMEKKPTGDEMLDALLCNSQIPMSEIRKYSGGHIWGEWKPQTGIILPNMIGHPDKRMALGHPEVMTELREVRAEPVIDTGGYEVGEECAFRLVNYRMPEVYCTVGQNIPSLHRRAPYNPVLINKKDMQTLGLKDGDHVLLENRFGSVEGIAKATEDLKPGVIGMTYGWSDPADIRDINEKGSNVQRIIPDDYRFDTVTGIALMTAIPVNVTALPKRQ
jgi:anaerobic selenocysteine-containing dehydrogenase